MIRTGLLLNAIFILFCGSGALAQVEANPTEYWGHGYIIGRPVHSSFSGIMFRTWEMEVNQGGFTDSSFYIGSNVDMSTEYQEVFDKFQGLSQDHLYVFEYIDKYPLNPEIEHSHLQITKIYTAAEFLAQASPAKDSKDVAAKIPTDGSTISRGLQKGRIVDVERYGVTGNFCVFELNTGGLSSSGDKSSEALMAFSALDENVCRWVEAKIAVGKDVEVTYAKDFFEIYEPSSYFANEVRSVEDGEGVVAAPVASNDIEKIKQQLLNDPAFVKELREKLANP